MTPRMTRKELARAGVVLPAGTPGGYDAARLPVRGVPKPLRVKVAKGLDHWEPWCNVEPNGTAVMGLPEPPSANRYWRVYRGRAVKSDAARAYVATIRRICAKIEPLDGPVAVQLHWWRGRKSGDLDNRLKVTLDALKGLAYHDDKQVIDLHAHRGESLYRGVGYIVVEVRADRRP